MTLHEYARLLLAQPDCTPEIDVSVMERNMEAPEGIKPFGVKIKLFMQVDTEAAALAFGKGMVMDICNGEPIPPQRAS